MTLRKRLFARFYDGVQRGYERLLGDRRRRLLAPLRGSVLELGPGTGINFLHLPVGEPIEWHGVEPNPHMRARLAERAAACGITPRFCELSGNTLLTEDDRFDFVVSTIVLCSVPDVDATLAEVRRVLRPGGRLLFLEHVAAPSGTWRRRVQNLVTPCWRAFADGCRLNRDTERHIERAGFENVECERFPARLPHIQGTAVAG